MVLKDFKAFLDIYGVKNNRALGQNFLYDPGLLRHITQQALISEGCDVLEIGAGAGSLTEALLESCGEDGSLVSVEIDLRLKKLLEERFKERKNLTFIFSDALKLDFGNIFQKSEVKKEMRVCANIPYYLTTDLIIKLISELPFAESFTLMLQAEAADRLINNSGKMKTRGPASLLIESYGRIRRLLKVSKEAFFPVPGVDSALIRIDRFVESERILEEKEENREFLKAYSVFLAYAFSERRKMLLPKLKSAYSLEWEEIFKGAGLDLKIRTEALKAKNLLYLFRKLWYSQRDVRHF